MTNQQKLVFEKVLEFVKFHKKEHPFIIGITGIDTSGKTKFAKELNLFLQENKLKTQLIKLDDFHNPKSIRYDGQNEADNYFNKSFNLENLISELLNPIKQAGQVQKSIKHLNLDTDKYDLEKTYNIDCDTIVILEGVFLFRKELLPFLDCKIFLHISFETARKRAKFRDIPIQGEEVMKKYETKYLPAQEKYLSEINPEKIADLTINNTDWENPKIISIKNHQPLSLPL